MKRSVIFSLTLSLLFGLSLLGCSGANDNKPKKDEIFQVVSFNLRNAKALAGSDSSSARSARAIEGDLNVLKILEDGSVISAIEIPENVTMNLASVEAIFQPPAGNDIVVLFNGQTDYYYTYEDGTQMWSGGWSQLLCIHPDGSFDDVLGWGSGKVIWLNREGYHNIIQFDARGNLYYICFQLEDPETGDGNYVFYQYNPETKVSTALTTPLSGSKYKDFNISKDGSHIFIEGEVSEYLGGGQFAKKEVFLEVVPVENPEASGKLVSNPDKYFDWTYDELTDALYVAEQQKSSISKYAGPDYTTGDLIKQDNTWYGALTATSDGIWAEADGENTYRLLDKERKYIAEKHALPAGYGFKNFLTSGPYLFVLADILEGDSENRTITDYHTLLKISADGSGEYSNIFAKVPEKDSIKIISWSASSDGSTVYFSGETESDFVSGKISTEDNGYTLISAKSKLTCIAAIDQNDEPEPVPDQDSEPEQSPDSGTDDEDDTNSEQQ